uniref:Uncharacterized protein n=1 Tax=Sphaerodactylus townsendi TaxID=933632 RepID=A0ACB8EUZ8_9SAUR
MQRLILFGDGVYTYRDVLTSSATKAAKVFPEQVGLKEAVAVFLKKNSPAYVWVWLGLAKDQLYHEALHQRNIRSKGSAARRSAPVTQGSTLTTPDFKTTVEDVLGSIRKEGMQVSSEQQFPEE